jgi:hypothetical protein
MQKGCHGPTVLQWQRGFARAAGASGDEPGSQHHCHYCSPAKQLAVEPACGGGPAKVGVELVAESLTVIETPQATDCDMQACP